MRENRPSGSEGGVALTTPSLPLSRLYGGITLPAGLTLDPQNGSVLRDEGFPRALGTGREPFPT